MGDIMLLHTETVIGRQKEIKAILDYIKCGKNLHIYGSDGAGKSALLDWVYNNISGFTPSLIPIYCRSSRTLRQILLSISGFLLGHFKHLESIDKFKRIKEIKYPSDIKKLNIRTLRNIAFSYISQDNFCVILDHLEYVTPKINAFLTVLYEKALVISASRQSWELADYAFRGKLDYCLYLTPKLRIENLQKKEAVIFIEYLCDISGVKISYKTQMFEDIFRITGGNPKMIMEIFEKAQMPQYLRGGILNLNLILIDCKMEKIHI
jgi:AAA+ ATPase superfamily predicted ATPase